MKVVLFDLDETLFDVTEFQKGAFEEIENYLKKENSNVKDVKNTLLNIWREKTSMHTNLFNDLLGIDKEEIVNKLVTIYNEHEGQLKLLPGTLEVLQSLKKYMHIGLISDGNVKRQQRKVSALGIEGIFDVVIFCQEFNAPKPSPTPFTKALNAFNDVSESFYVGDNPLLDFKGAKVAGMKTIRLKRGEFKKLPSGNDVDYEISDIKEIERVIADG